MKYVRLIVDARGQNLHRDRDADTVVYIHNYLAISSHSLARNSCVVRFVTEVAGR